MKNKTIFFAAFAALATTACQDENQWGPGLQEGYLYFNVSEGHGWADDSKATRSEVEAPMLMENSISGGQPIYLHTEVTPTMSPELEAGLNNIDYSEDAEGNVTQTRGVRYTGDVFTPSTSADATHPKIGSFGVYAATSEDVLFNFKEIGPTFTNTSHGHTGTGPDHYDYQWNVKEEEITGIWNDGVTADFYGYAPFFGTDGTPVSSTNGLSIDASGAVPILTYTAQTDVTKQLDILTAHTEVSHSEGIEQVELEFNHVMSAIKFYFKKGTSVKTTSEAGYTAHSDPDDPTAPNYYTKAENSFTWNDGLADYDVTVTNIQIKNVYTTGTWEVGKDPYSDANGFVWSDPSTEGSFAYAPAKALKNETSTVDLNPDYEENVFMMLPQIVPDNALIELTCSLTPSGESIATKTMTLKVPLKESGGTTNKKWKAGYTYTYTISLSDFAYVFDYNTATAKNYNGGGTGVGYTGTYEENVFIRSYKIDSKGNKTNVNWKPQYQEIDADVTGVGQGGTGDQEVWKDGSNGWIHIYDHTDGTYNNIVNGVNINEVKATHGGAHEGESDDIRLFKIEIGTIMTPIIDLSLWNQYQTKRWKGRSTSNCYIVAGPGTYRIPLIYGNAWTKGVVNSVAYNSGLTPGSGDNYLGAFLNAYDQPITSPFIKKDVEHYSHSIKDAVLIWEEGACATNGTVTEGMRHSMGGGTAGDKNIGTVVKVISTIDDAVTGEDTYNAENDTYGTQTGCDYLQFELDYTNFNYGNAVVGIRDDQNQIVWSWHIWMVNADDFIKDNVTLDLSGNQITYANTNIGWVDGGQTMPAQTRTGKMRLVQDESDKKITIDAEQQKRRQFTTYFTNVLYQWGRKDPIRGNVNTADMNSDYGAPRGEAGVTSYSKADFSNPSGLLIYGEKGSIGGMIQHPNKAYGLSDGDLYSTVYFNLWASKLKKVYNTNGGTWIFYGKTIYDPSPVGYCVPPSKCLTKLSRGGFADVTSSATLPIVCLYNSTLKFHGSGVRTTTAGYDLKARGYDTPDTFDPFNAFYHTATPYSHDENWQMHLYFYSGIDTHNFIRGDMSECLSVKPVLWNGEAKETEELDQDKEYLTFTFLESGAIYWQDSHSAATSRTISYSLDKGSTWNTVTSSFSGSGTKIADVTNTTVLMVKGTNNLYCRVVGGVYYYQHFHSTAGYELSGNIMSMTWGDDFVGKTAFKDGSTFTFCSMFYDPENSGNTNPQLESVDGLVMPAMSLVESCYESMFQGCTNLVSGPALPATSATDATNCYKNMFKNCTNLNTVNVMLDPQNTITYTGTWLDGVASGGTFFYRNGATWPAGTSGIPSSWSSVPLD